MKPVTLGQLWRGRNPTSIYIRIWKLIELLVTPSTPMGNKSKEDTIQLAFPNLQRMVTCINVLRSWIIFSRQLKLPCSTWNIEKHDCSRNSFPLQALPMFHVKPAHHHKTKKNETAQLPINTPPQPQHVTHPRFTWNTDPSIACGGEVVLFKLPTP